MNTPADTRDLIVAYLVRVGEERPTKRICEYMFHEYRITPGATRMCLARLLKAGDIERPEHGYYRAKP